MVLNLVLKSNIIYYSTFSLKHRNEKEGQNGIFQQGKVRENRQIVIKECLEYHLKRNYNNTTLKLRKNELK